MALNCEKFIWAIPGKTLKFLDIVLPDLKYYVSKNNTLVISSDYSVSNDDVKIAIILMNKIREIKDYDNLFGVLQLRDFSFKSKDSDSKKKYEEFKEFYDEYTYLFDWFEDEVKYDSMTPLKFLHTHLKKLGSYDKELFCNIVGAKKDVLDKLKGLVTEENKKISEKIKESISAKIPIQLLSYFECASKIREELFNNRKNLNSEYFSSVEDINAIALFLSLYFYDDIKSNDQLFISERDTVIRILKDAGIDLDGIKRITNLNINSCVISNHVANYLVIDKVYGIYFDNFDYNSIYDVVKKVLSKSYSDSIALEKIFLRLNCYLSMINLSREAFVQATEEEKLRVVNEYTKNFYSDLSWQVREFINFTAKTYSYLLKLMKKNGINSNFVKTEDDVDTLALYVASHYFGGDVDIFFSSLGVSYEKVLDKLELKITKEEIEAMPLDVKALIERFKRYVYEGVNSRKKSKNLAIKDIVHNLCNKSFNRSSIMNDVFESLSNGEFSLDEDFLSQLNKYFEDREKAMKEELKVELFHNMPLDTVDYLDNVSGIYSSLSKCTDLEEKDMACYALLLGAFIKDRSDICKFFNHIGFNYKGILSSIGIVSSKNWDDPNVEVLKKFFKDYIFGGVNKNCKREDITIKQIVKNVFNKELNDSFYINKLLNTFGFSYEIFDKFDKLYDETLIDIEQEEIKNGIEKKIGNRSYDTANYVRYTLRIFNELKRGFLSTKLNTEIIKDDNDLKELSLILAALAYPNNASKFLTKYEITFERVCEYYNLDSYSLLEVAKNSTYNTFDLMTYFTQYMVDKNERINDIDDIINNIFDERLNNSLVVENICNNFGISYPILKREVLSKTDYEDTLSIEERTNLLLNEKVDSLELNDRKSLLRYGNDLGSHSKYIFDELPRLQLNDTNDSSVIEIKSSLDKLYLSTEQKKRGLFGLFSKKEANQVKNINEGNLRILKSQIDDKIQILEKELSGYDALREYMEAYRKKNKEYLVNINELMSSLEEQAALSGSSDDELNEKLKCDEKIRFMRAKADRFLVSDELCKQNLIGISQRINAHNLTINSLEMARDIFIPVVWSQLAIAKGANTANSSLEIANTVINLFESLLIKNAESTFVNMGKLEDIKMSGDILVEINNRVNTYMSTFNDNPEGITDGSLSLGTLGSNSELVKKKILTEK